MNSIHSFPWRLLPPGAFSEVARTSCDYISELHPEERAAVAQANLPRQAEYATGRALVRQLLQKLGADPMPLFSGPDRMPVWPDGIVGSISHSSGLCAVAVAGSDTVTALGIDLEAADPLEPELWPLVGTSDEITCVAEFLSTSNCGLAAKALFSAKEAAFKCWYPDGKAMIEFTDATLVRQPGSGLLGLTVQGQPYIYQGCDRLLTTLEEGFIFCAAWKAAVAPERVS